MISLFFSLPQSACIRIDDDEFMPDVAQLFGELHAHASVTAQERVPHQQVDFLGHLTRYLSTANWRSGFLVESVMVAPRPIGSAIASNAREARYQVGLVVFDPLRTADVNGPGIVRFRFSRSTVTRSAGVTDTCDRSSFGHERALAVEPPKSPIVGNSPCISAFREFSLRRLLWTKSSLLKPTELTGPKCRSRYPSRPPAWRLAGALYPRVPEI